MSEPQKMRATGRLRLGVFVDGVWHRDFELRLPNIADNIEAVDEVGAHNGVAVNAAMLARQLVRLGTLDRKQITYDLLCGMHPADYNLLDQKAGELEKKLWAELAAAETNSSESASPSPSSA